jgi:very-short-patch-repair endonuclease
MSPTQKKPPQITNRARDMRHSPTPAEKNLWAVLRNRKIDGCKFVRQYPISTYIVDFCCWENKLVIEVDGGVHIWQEVYDHRREYILTELGYKVIRFTNDDVIKNINAVVAIIQEVPRQ